MSKKFAFVHSDKTFTIEMPDQLFVTFSAAVDNRFIRTKLTDTQQGLRGAKLDMVIVDEIVDDETYKKLLTNITNQSTIKTNQGSNPPGKEQ